MDSPLKCDMLRLGEVAILLKPMRCGDRMIMPGAVFKVHDVWNVSGTSVSVGYKCESIMGDDIP